MEFGGLGGADESLVDGSWCPSLVEPCMTRTPRGRKVSHALSFHLLCPTLHAVAGKFRALITDSSSACPQIHDPSLWSAFNWIAGTGYTCKEQNFPLYLETQMTEHSRISFYPGLPFFNKLNSGKTVGQELSLATEGGPSAKYTLLEVIKTYNLRSMM